MFNCRAYGGNLQQLKLRGSGGRKGEAGEGMNNEYCLSSYVLKRKFK